MKKLLIFVSMLSFVLISSNLFAAKNNPGRLGHLMQQLNDEQKTIVREKVKSMKEQGAKREEIRAEVNTLLESYGIEIPEHPETADPELRGLRFLHKLGNQLNEEQKEALKMQHAKLWREGQPRSTIQAEMKKMLTEYGIDLPDRQRPERTKDDWEDKLSNDQRAELRKEMKDLYENGASTKEMKEKMKEKLASYGVELPKREARPGRRRQVMRWLKRNLSEAQLAEVKAKAKSLRENGNTPDEIAAQVKEMVNSYGMEMPESFRKPRRDGDHHLTREQRKELRGKIREMREDGSSGKEIRQYIDGFLETNSKETKNYKLDGSEVKNSNTNLKAQSYPNPFNPETSIQYSLNEPAAVTVKIFDIQGKQVRNLVDEYKQAGTFTVRWDGLDDNSNQMASGVYFFRITAGQEMLNKRIVLMK